MIDFADYKNVTSEIVVVWEVNTFENGLGALVLLYHENKLIGKVRGEHGISLEDDGYISSYDGFENGVWRIWKKKKGITTKHYKKMFDKFLVPFIMENLEESMRNDDVWKKFEEMVKKNPTSP